MWLRITESDGEGRMLEVRGDRNVIGSDAGAPTRLNVLEPAGARVVELEL